MPLTKMWVVFFMQTINKYSGYLDQDNNLSVDLCIRICQALGKSLDELFWPEN